MFRAGLTVALAADRSAVICVSPVRYAICNIHLLKRSLERERETHTEKERDRESERKSERKTLGEDSTLVRNVFNKD